MTTETVNILALIFGFLGVLFAIFAIIVQFQISKMPNKLIQEEDERAKNMIEEGNKRVERILSEVLKRV